jgi:hypothetical protein
MLSLTTSRYLFGAAGALILSGLLLAPYDFAAAAQTLAGLAVTALSTLAA